ncbi:MAG: hypothetical protein IPM29_15570 [Planctomycetes bacterium]|nr:hypothetical protein [Planctomycetota bacterium]
MRHLPSVLAIAALAASAPAQLASYSQFGSGCGGTGASSYYELFNGGNFDLSNLTPGILHLWNGTTYAVVPAAGPMYMPTGTPITFGDDQVQTISLPFPVPTTVGTINSIDVCSNGYIWLQTNPTADYTPSVGEFLSQGPRFCAAWHDLNPSSSGGGAMYAETDPATGKFVVCWENVPEYPATGANTLQVAFDPSGNVEFRYGNCTFAGTGLVGYSPGNNGADPGPMDISAITGFSLGTGIPHLALVPVTRPVIGQTAISQTRYIRPGSLSGVARYGVRAPSPISLAGIGAPGCDLLVPGLAGVPFATAGTAANNPLPIPQIPGIAGVVLDMQSIVLSPAANALGVALSNGVSYTINVN